MRVFVAWDFTEPRARKLLEAVAEFGGGFASDGREMVWTIPGQREQEEAGPIGSRLVARNIADADVVLALVDRANANVGWEIGLALGMGKQLRLASVGKSPAFRLGALAGHLVSQVETWQALGSVVAQKDWTFPIPPRDPGAGATYILCPSGPEGSGLREALQRERAEGVVLVDPLTEKLERVPALLESARRLIWVVTLQADEGSRDGDENVSNAVIAGLAHAAGWPVNVLQSKDARRLVDLAESSIDFNGLKDFVRQVRNLAAAPAPPLPAPPDRPTCPKLPLTSLSHFEQEQLLGELQRLFDDPADISRLAASVGVGKLVAFRAPDKLWRGVLRALKQADGNIGPIVQAALEMEPTNPWFIGLRGRGGVAPS